MQNIKQQYLVLAAQSYRLEDEKTGEIRDGISIWYYPDNNLEPEVDLEAEKTGAIQKGKKLGKMSLPMEQLPKVTDVPGLYEVEMKVSMVANKPQLKPVNIDFIERVKLAKPNK